MTNTSAIQGTRKSAKELADGTLRVSIDVEPNDKAKFHALFPDIDMPIAIAPMVPVAEGFAEIVNVDGLAATKFMENQSRYGQQAKELRLSTFFRRPEVWMAVGPDSDFLAWLKTQDCAAKVPHSGDIVAAHVRRVANGAGTGIKPEYSAIPLCDHHHSLQHLQGESAINTREWWDQKRIDYLIKWCWTTLKDQLGYSSWSDVPPIELLSWAERNGVDTGPDGNMWLPRCYYDNEHLEKL